MTVTSSTVDPARTQPALRAIETAFSASVLHPAVLEAGGLGSTLRISIPMATEPDRSAFRSDW